MIVLWGLRGDGPLKAVHEALTRSGAEVVVLDQMRTADFTLDFTAGATIEGALTTPEWRIPLDELRAIYLRPYDFRRIPATARAGAGSHLWRHAEQFDDALLTWTEVTDSLVVNRSSAMASNNSKPYQSLLIAAAGLATPRTIVTNDVGELRAFIAEHGSVIYKSASGVRSIVRRLDSIEDARAAHLRWCPTQFQAYVPGMDYRVHVVNEQTFVSRIASAAVDYRYATDSAMSADMTAARLPDDVNDTCVRLARSLGLVVAGIDLRETPDGEFQCFEVNPSPGFTFFENATGQPIATAVAEALLDAVRTT